MDKARLKKLYDDYNAVTSVIKTGKFAEASSQIRKLLVALSDFQNEAFPKTAASQDKENQSAKEGLFPSPDCDSKLALVIVGSLLNKIHCYTDGCSITDVNDIVHTFVQVEAWIAHLAAAKQPVAQYVDTMCRMAINICIRIDNKLQTAEGNKANTVYEKLELLRSTTMKIFEKTIKTNPELYFEQLYRSFVIMQRFKSDSAAKFTKECLDAQQKVVLSYDRQIEPYLTCFYSLGRCLEKDGKYEEAAKNYEYIRCIYLEKLKTNKRIADLTYTMHSASAILHRVLLALTQLGTEKYDEAQALGMRKTVVSYTVKGAELTKKILAEIDIAEEIQKVSITKQVPPTYDTLNRLNTVLREIRRVLSTDVCSIGSASGPKFKLQDKILGELEELMLIHSQLVHKGLDIDSKYATKGSLLVKFQSAEHYEWEALTMAALIAFEGNKNDAKLACVHLESATELIRDRKKLSELKTIATLYYNIGIHFYNNKAYSVAAEPLFKSCEIYEEWGQTNQMDDKILSKRKELVSICRQKSNDVDGALKEIEDGIVKTLVASKGDISKLVKRFCAIKIQTASKKEFKSYTLIKALDKVKVSQIQKGQALEEEFDFYDKYDKEEWAQEVLDILLKQVYQAKEHPIRRARVLLDRAQYSRRKFDISAAIQDVEEAIELLKGNVYGDKEIQDAMFNDLATSYAWLAILKREMTDESSTTVDAEIDGILSVALQTWTSIVNKLDNPSSIDDKETIEASRKFFGAPEKTLNLWLLLVDLFALLDDKKKHIHIHKLLIRLHRCVIATKESEYECINLYASIGSIYHRMGFTRTAAQYINKSKSMLDKAIDIPEKYKVDWLLATTCYLYEVGQISNTDELEKIEKSQFSIIYGKKKRSKAEYFILAQSKAILATMRSERGQIHEALSDALEAMRLRMSGLPKQNLDVLKRVEAEGNKKDDDPDNQVRREDEDGANLSVDEGEGKSATPEDFVNENMTFTKWNALKAFAESLQQTATLYELQGSVYYAEYYYLKGMYLASILNAPRLKASFLLHLAKLCLKKRHWEEWNKRIAELLEAQKESQIHDEVEVQDDDEQIAKSLKEDKDASLVETSIYMGDFKRKQAFDAVGALTHYQEAESYLLELMDSSVVSAIDNIILNNTAETPRVNKIISRIKSKEKGADSNKVRLSLDPITAPKSTARGKKATSVSTLASIEDCLPLKRMKTRIDTKKARIEMMKAIEQKDVSLLHEAEKILKACLAELEQFKSASSKSTDIDKAVVLYHLGRVFLLRSELEGDTSCKALPNWSQSETVVGASPFVTKNRRGQKKSTKADSVSSKSWLAEAQSMLERALMYCTGVGSIPKLTQDICQCLALIIGNSEPCRTAFLLNYSLGITLRHEMLTLISQKLMSFRRKKLELLGDVELSYLEETDSEEIDETASNRSGDTINLDEDQDMLDDDAEVAALTKDLEVLDLTNQPNRRLNFNEDEADEDTDEVQSAENIKVKSFTSTKQPKGSAKEEKALKESLGHLRKLYKLFSFDVDYKPSDFQSQFIDCLPVDWVVCSVALTADKRYVLVTRLQARKIPIVVRIAVKSSNESSSPDTVKKSATSASIKAAPAKRAVLSRTKSEISKQALRASKDDSESDSDEVVETKKAPARAPLKRSTTTVGAKPKKAAATAVKPVAAHDEANTNTKSSDDSSASNLMDRIKREYEAILDESKNTTVSSSDNRDSSEYRSKWWTQRFKLDEQLKSLVDDKLQGQLLGYWKSLLVGTAADEKLRARFFKLAYDLKQHFSQRFTQAEKTRDDLYEAFIESFEFLSDLDIKSWVVYLTHGESTVEDEEAINELVEHVKREYAAQISDKSAIKAKPATTKKKAAEETVPESSTRRNPMILILDKSLQSLPWESMACLRSTPVSRMPSLSFVRARLRQLLSKTAPDNCLKNGIDASKAYYFLNPSKDLASSQEKLEPLFKKFRWQGLAGKAPSKHDFEDALSMHDLVVYCGHNAGEQYIARNHVAQVSHVIKYSTEDRSAHDDIVRSKSTLKASGSTLLHSMLSGLDKKAGVTAKPQSNPDPDASALSELTYMNYNAVTLLMGCSSGKLVDNGDFDPDGPILSYLLAGSPAVVGCLWIVTATDTDRLTEGLFAKWFDECSDVSLPEMIIRAREECKLKYLNGAAFVCYGLPVFLKGHVPSYYAAK